MTDVLRRLGLTCERLHEQAVERIQTGVDQQAQPKQPATAREYKQPVHGDGRRRVQRIRANAASLRRIVGLSQQMVQVNQPASEQPQPGAEPMPSVKHHCDELERRQMARKVGYRTKLDDASRERHGSRGLDGRIEAMGAIGFQLRAGLDGGGIHHHRAQLQFHGREGCAANAVDPSHHREHCFKA